jgi:hypothetical protein
MGAAEKRRHLGRKSRPAKREGSIKKLGAGGSFPRSFLPQDT